MLALLETPKANLPWDGSVEKRDQLLTTAQWLTDKYDAMPVGWSGAPPIHYARPGPDAFYRRFRQPADQVPLLRVSVVRWPLGEE